MSAELIDRIQAAQDEMILSAQNCFESSELEDLRVIIRITFEFNSFARSRIRRSNTAEMQYVLHTVASGIDSFIAVSAAYRMLANTARTTIRWGRVSEESLIEKFVRVFSRFASEDRFERKVRLLLDLFRIQIVFLGVCYR